ncbi:MAG: HupE/UreJ family protein [Acidobacteriota bacterium]|nr:HupE/UreJ family protein [Acidobacteriota bacterium]
MRGREVSAQLTFNLLDFAGVDQNGDKVVSPEEFAQAFKRVYETILHRFALSSSGPPVRFTRDKYELFDEHVLLLNLTYVFPQQVLALQMTSTLPDALGRGHVHLASVNLGGRLQAQILDNRNRTAFFTQSSGRWWQTLGRFVWLGIQHIATGYDHLAFLLGLLIATATLRSLVKVITSFTLAHSITLALATFNVIILPSRFTESMIAASNLYVALENLLRKRTMDRWKLTFLFGLVHGFGFSNVLREMQLPRENLALSLFSFNLGVEIGQVVFVILLFPAIADLVQSGWTKLRPAVSIAVGLLAAYWLIQRVFFG